MLYIYIKEEEKDDKIKNLLEAWQWWFVSIKSQHSRDQGRKMALSSW